MIDVWIISKMKVLVRMHESLRNEQANKDEMPKLHICNGGVNMQCDSPIHRLHRWNSHWHKVFHVDLILRAITCSCFTSFKFLVVVVHFKNFVFCSFNIFPFDHYALSGDLYNKILQEDQESYFKVEVCYRCEWKLIMINQLREVEILMILIMKRTKNVIFFFQGLFCL